MGTEAFLGRTVAVTIDRPLGTLHPQWGFRYQLNYGFVPHTRSGDGEEVDVYVLGISEPIDTMEGRVIAVVRRLEGDDDKLVVVPLDFDATAVTEDAIEAAIAFQVPRP